MTFTEDDLKQLKLRLSADYFVRNKFVDAQDMEALLARLEAAENICLFQQTHYFGKAPELENLYRQWFKTRGDGGRKAAGK
jgi:hypothetical protein